MAIVKAALLLVAALMVGFIVAGIVFANLRFFLWIGIVGLAIYVIYSLVTGRSGAARHE